MDTFSIFTLASWLAILLVSGLLLFAFAKSDCDLTLAFYERFGKKPSKVMMGKVVWITGASSGIGEQLAYALAACGARLVLSGRKERRLRRVLEKCKGERRYLVKSLHVKRCMGSIIKFMLDFVLQYLIILPQSMT